MSSAWITFFAGVAGALIGASASLVAIRVEQGYRRKERIAEAAEEQAQRAGARLAVLISLLVEADPYNLVSIDEERMKASLVQMQNVRRRVSEEEALLGELRLVHPSTDVRLQAALASERVGRALNHVAGAVAMGPAFGADTQGSQLAIERALVRREEAIAALEALAVAMRDAVRVAQAAG